jgi:hypothetical protein
MMGGSDWASLVLGIREGRCALLPPALRFDSPDDASVASGTEDARIV